MCNTPVQRVWYSKKLHIEILDYDWAMTNRVWKSFVIGVRFFCTGSCKFTRADIFHIALEIMWLPILIITNISTINLG